MIQKQSALQGAEKPEPVPMERTTTVWKLAEWLGVTETGIRVSEDNDWNKQRAAAPGQGFVRMLACCEEIRKVKKRSDSPDFSDWFQVIFSDTCIARYGNEDPPAVQQEGPPSLLQIIMFYHFIHYVNFSVRIQGMDKIMVAVVKDISLLIHHGCSRGV